MIKIETIVKEGSNPKMVDYALKISGKDDLESLEHIINAGRNNLIDAISEPYAEKELKHALTAEVSKADHMLNLIKSLKQLWIIHS